MRPVPTIVGLLFVALGATAVVSGATDADWWWWVVAAGCAALGVSGLVVALGTSEEGPG